MSIASQLSFSTATSVRGGALGSIPYQSASSSTLFVSIGAAGTVLTSSGTVPIWSPASSTTVGTSTQVNTVLQTASNAYYLTFVDSNNAVSTAEAVYTTSTFTINPATGFVGIGSQDGGSPLNVKVLSTLSGTINSFQKVFTTQASGGVGNNVYRSEWRRRRAAGTDWVTQNIHDGIWVDGSFTTPGTDTRTWWDRDPNTTSQAWGDQATTWMFVNSTGLGVRTTTPSHALHVKNGTASGTLSLSGGAEVTGGASYIIMGNNDSGGVTGPNVIVSANRTLQFGHGTSFTLAGGGTFTSRLSITSNGGIAFGTSSANYGTAGQVLQSNGDAAPTWVSAVSNSIFMLSSDDRIKAPADDNAGAMRFGFTSFANNNSAPYADYLHLRSYSDGTGGNDNLVMFRKDAIGIRVWQQAWGSATAYSTFKDVAFTDSSITGAAGQVNTTARTTNAVHYLTFVDSNNATATAESVYTTSTFVINPQTGNVSIGIATPQYVLDVNNSNASIFQASFGSTLINGGVTGIHFGYSEAANQLYRKSAIVFERSDGAFGDARGKVHILNGPFGSGSATLADAKLTIATDGNVGVGTTSPPNKFVVSNAGAAGLEIAPTGGLSSGPAIISYNRSGAAYTPITHYGLNHTWFVGAAGATRAVDIDSSGNVSVLVGQTNTKALSVDGLYNSTLQTLALTLGTETWVKLATLGNRCFAVFRVSVGSNNSEEDSEIEIAGNYVLTPSAITVKRMTYNGHLREVRIVQSAGGAAKIIYIRVRTSDFAPSVQWRLVNTHGFSSIHNIVETPAAGESVIVVNNVEHVTTYNSTVRSLGVGTTSSAVIGEIRATNEITAYYSSDIRLKENIRLIADPITIVNQIRGVYYDWTDEHMAARGGEDGYFVRKHDIGVIAQEVEKVLPEIVATRDDGTKVVKYEKIVALLIEAVKDQQQQINQISQALQNLTIK